MIESVTDLRFIQELLGHSSSKTTEIYTHVSKKSITNIVSPLDFLFSNYEGELAGNEQRLLNTAKK